MDKYVIKLNKKTNSSSDGANLSVAATAASQSVDCSVAAAAASQSVACSSNTAEMSSESSDSTDSEAPCGAYPKRVQKFRLSWLVEFTWMQKKKGPKDTILPYCKICKTCLSNNKTHIRRHEHSFGHKKGIASLKKQPKIDKVEKLVTFKRKEEKKAEAELQIIMFLLEHNLPFSLTKPLISLTKSVSSDVTKYLKCGKTKATLTVNTFLREEGELQIASILRIHKFSLIIDETTDVSTKKCLVLVVRYFDMKMNCVIDRFLAMLELKSSTSKSIYKAIVEYFKHLNVPLENLVGFASDNASAMMGGKSGVKTLLKKDQPYLYVMGCVCHSISLCSSAAAKKLPNELEVCVRKIYAFFAHSSKRQTEFKEMQEYFAVKPHKILSLAPTRWLSLEAVVKRILEQWVPLHHYFISYKLENRNKNNEKMLDLAENILTQLNDGNKVYFFFLAYILNIINKINIEFQTEKPRIHVLLPTVKAFFTTILQNFIKPEYISAVFLKQKSVDDVSILKDTKDIHIGANAALLISKGTIPLNEVNDLKKHCCSYYVELSKQILKRFDFTDKCLIALQGINPKNLSSSIVDILSLFPNFINEGQIEDLEEEWRCLISMDTLNKDLDLESFWTHVFSLKNGLNEKMFPLTKIFVGAILSLPHSSAAAERKFSEYNLIKDKKRNCLLNSTVHSILITKELLRNKNADEYCNN